MAKLKIEIVTAERTVLEAEADMIIAPGSEGQLGLLPRHAPLLTMLEPGEIRLKDGGRDTLSFAVAGGFLEILDNRVIVLADSAERADEIDLARAEAAIQKAQERIASHATDLDLERALTSLRRANIRLRVARRRRATGAPSPPRPGS